ncbi:dynamin family protein [Coleofasciculus sp. FACHB-1120]|uniref:dynamin family protein n=1 Tax=Coleofasciculus sp. FACHB-1120 TaxID=2692783 RepID=UPI0016873FD9|nr:dynamin family protein [Coleofasciculus sp. FACHB-1120]MBD2743923.1 dynamin family protein [Coleofasciculus sp. FACHB-1120]
MSSEQFQAAHDSIYITGRLLLQSLQEIRATREGEGEDTKALQRIENDITKALYALKEQKYQVAVIAPLNAGKNTFFNALMGADILPSEAEASTDYRTDIRHIDSGQVPRFLEYREGNRQPVAIASGDAVEIAQKFLERIHDIQNHHNLDNTIRFEIEHPIEAISTLSSLAGFTLTDLPVEHERESIELPPITDWKQMILEALRISDVILFVFNDRDLETDSVSSFLNKLIDNYRRFLSVNQSKVFFVVNEIEPNVDTDKNIPRLIETWKQKLLFLGFLNPIIYSASSRKGLLAKLIQSSTATSSHTKEFVQVFLGNYIEETEEGEFRVPQPIEIAPKALKDSGVPVIQEIVLQTIIQNSGWNLLNGVLTDLNKAAKAMENSLDTSIRNWEIETESLRKNADSQSLEPLINEPIQTLENEVNHLATEPQKQEAHPGQIVAILKERKAQLNEYMDELTSIRKSLDSWKPVQASS